jgi:hypothetical protein
MFGNAADVIDSNSTDLDIDQYTIIVFTVSNLSRYHISVDDK